jgi:hypothetical protein
MSISCSQSRLTFDIEFLITLTNVLITSNDEIMTLTLNKQIRFDSNHWV